MLSCREPGRRRQTGPTHPRPRPSSAGFSDKLEGVLGLLHRLEDALLALILGLLVLLALVQIVRRTGMVPMIAFNAEPGKRDAVPHWKASVAQKSKTAELTTGEMLTSRGLVEVNLQQPKGGD